MTDKIIHVLNGEAVLPKDLERTLSAEASETSE